MTVRRRSPRHLLAALIVSGTLARSTSHAKLTISEVRIDPAALAPECSEIGGEYAVSMQARTHFETVGDFVIGWEPPRDKSF
jgi:hypothetical protein